MAWENPVTTWGQAGKTVPGAGDFNRIEGNIQELQNTKETPAGAQDKAEAAAGAVRAELDAHKNEVATQTEYGHIRLSDIPTSEGIPRGIIVMWSGSVEEIPSGWALCDGQNGTPDLRDRFIVGAGNEYDVGDTGGEKEVTLSTSQIPSHRHSSGTLSTSSDGGHSHSGSSASAGSHSHDYTRPHLSIGVIKGEEAYSRGGSTNVNTTAGGSHSHTITIGTAGSHSHSVSGYTGYVGSGDSHENRPPYYALAFIMKL